MAKGDLQFAGEFLVEECKLLTTKGLEIDISALIENINIYEDIFSMTVSGDILFKDTNNLVLNYKHHNNHLSYITMMQHLSLTM